MILTYQERLERERLPDFKTSEEWNDWVKEKKRYYGSDDFLASNIYGKAYPIIKKLDGERRKEWNAKHHSAGMKRLEKAGLKEGDRVEYFSTPYLGPSVTLRGEIKIFKRGPVVKLDARSASLAGKKTSDWNEEWTK